MTMTTPLQDQFDENPYPRIPLEKSPLDDPQSLYHHAAINAFYARDRKLSSVGSLRILDAGCGTGYVSLTLALANPGATVVGIDVSARSLEIARERCARHGVTSVRFAQCSLTDAASLQQEFDYIHCGDTLYFFADPAVGLAALNQVLAPRGIIRADLHNARQRQRYLRAQELFRELGVLDDEPAASALAFVRQLFGALHDKVPLKLETWRGKITDGLILSNHLLRDDHGFSLPEVFSAIERAHLKFLGMTDSPRWNIDAMFQSGRCELERILNRIRSPEDYFRISDLLNYNGRLYSFWCGRPEIPVVSRLGLHSPQTRVQLHPLLSGPRFERALQGAARTSRGFRLGQFIPFLGRLEVSASTAGLMAALIDRPQTVAELTQRWTVMHPVSYLTLKPLPPVDAERAVQSQLIHLEQIGAIHLEEPSSTESGLGPA